MSQNSDECQACGGTGWVHPPGHAAVARCECQKQRIVQERIRTVLNDWPRYADAQLDDRPRTLPQKAVLDAIRENPSGSYFITGNYESGKTHVLIAQYRYQALAGRNCILRSSKQLMDELRKAEITPPDGEQPFESPVLQMVNLAPAGHLFWDDIEKAAARSEFRAEAVFDLLDTICRRQLGLTVTSNVGLAQLAQTMGSPVISRLDRICKVIQL